ncbi:MAG: hypothetical protein ACO307_18955 [Ilumatobacteraceae bacterium]
MFGSVFEWLEDCWHDDYTRAGRWLGLARPGRRRLQLPGR